jgi:hypothetical protein
VVAVGDAEASSSLFAGGESEFTAAAAAAAAAADDDDVWWRSAMPEHQASRSWSSSIADRYTP